MDVRCEKCGTEYELDDAKVTEAGTSSQWHGIRAVVRLFDGSIIESSEGLAVLQLQIDQVQTRQDGDA